VSRTLGNNCSERIVIVLKIIKAQKMTSLRLLFTQVALSLIYSDSDMHTQPKEKKLGYFLLGFD